MADLPGELVDSVIDLVHTYPSTLAACSLVSRQWLPRTRYYSFSSIRLVRSRNEDSVKPFLHILTSPLATFISSVREVYIFHESFYGTPVLSAGDIIALLSRHGVAPTLLNVTCHFNHLGRAGLYPSPTHVQLILTGAPLHAAFEDIVDFVHDFSSLTSLGLNIQQPMANTGKPCRVLSPTLQELQVIQPRILSCILSLESPPISPRLVLHFPSRHRWAEAERYLSDERIRGALQSLTLADCDAYPLPTSLASLRHLSIWQPFPSMAPHARVALSSLSRSPAARTLETVEFLDSDRRLTFDRDGLNKSWTDVDAMLADTAQWPRLRAVILCGEDLEQTVEPLRRELPLCDARGILFVQYRSTESPYWMS